VKTVAYAKMGRSIKLDPGRWGVVGGDQEPLLALRYLAHKFPEVRWLIVGRNSGECPQDVGLPSNVENPWHGVRVPISKDSSDQAWRRAAEMVTEWTRGVDGWVVWAGQHGTHNTPIPKLTEEGDAVPLVSFLNYAGPVVEALNAWQDGDPQGREPVWLVSESLNYLKARDLRWPRRRPILSQFDFHRPSTQYRGELSLGPATLGFMGSQWHSTHADSWLSRDVYRYSGLELLAVDGFSTSQVPWEDRVRFGVVANEGAAPSQGGREEVFREYVWPLHPDFVRGQWSEKTLIRTGWVLHPVPYAGYQGLLGTSKSTVITSNGCGWPTPKPWECFAVGVVAFFAPGYDVQGHILPTLEQLDRDGGRYSTRAASLARMLRVTSVSDLLFKVDVMNRDRGLWEAVVREQRWMLERAVEKDLFGKMIGERLAG
jgi:hypothetical protein